MRDKIASEWAGAEDWRDTRKRCQPAMGKRDFLTFALMFVKHSAVHRPNIAESVGPKKKEPRHLGLPDNSIASRTEGTTVQLCGKSNVANLGPMATTRWERSAKNKLVEFNERFIRGGGGKWCVPW